jgi:site-specific DNA-methyltransferase (adenine-specific)
MVEWVEIGDARLACGDCLQILPTLDKVDLVATDPPYLLESGGNTTKDMRGKFSKDVYDNSGQIVDTPLDWSDFMPALFHVLSANAHAYVMCNNRHVQGMLSAASDTGFKFHNLLVWNKETATPNRWYMKNLEFTGFLYKGKAFRINDCGSKQLNNIPIIKNAEHPTEKPSELMRVYIENSSSIGDVILDPFMGVASTGVACAKLGRKFIGIELDEHYFKIACERIQKAYDQPDLFIAPPKKAEQVGMDI